MGQVEGKVVIVTGAASGIGLATAKRLLDDGAVVVGADLDAGPGTLGDRWTYVPTDVTDEAAVAALVAAAVQAGGRLDGVVNAAGVAGGGLAHLVDAAEWQRVIAVNLTGTFFVAKHVIAPAADPGTRSTASAARSSRSRASRASRGPPAGAPTTPPRAAWCCSRRTSPSTTARPASGPTPSAPGSSRRR